MNELINGWMDGSVDRWMGGFGRFVRNKNQSKGVGGVFKKEIKLKPK